MYRPKIFQTENPFQHMVFNNLDLMTRCLRNILVTDHIMLTELLLALYTHFAY